MTPTGTPPERRGDERIASPPCGLRLLPAWSSPSREFGENLAKFLCGRTVPVLRTTSPRNHSFWRTVQLRARFPWRGVMDSALVHLGLFSLLYAASTWPQPRLHLMKARFYRVQTGTQLSLSLPELHGAPTQPVREGKADPLPARQEIRSLPNEPDNRHQTIVTPPKLKLQQDVALPNLVAFQPLPPEAAALPAPIPRPAPAPAPAPAAKPAPHIAHLQAPRPMPQAPRSATQPAPSLNLPPKSDKPELAELMPLREKPLLAAQPVVNPPPARPHPAIVLTKPERFPARRHSAKARPAPADARVGALARKNASDLANLFSTHAAPKLQPQPQPRPGKRQDATPQVVALSTHPAAVAAPVKIPEGNRRGEFAASPTGRAGATGTAGARDSEGKGARHATGKVNAPPGIDVAALPPDAPLPDAPSAGDASMGGGTGAPAAGTDLRSKLMAAMRTPPILHPPPRRSAIAENPGPRNELENHVFAGRRAYTLVANSPNLNSYIGSWIIRYVERNQGLRPTPIAPPRVVRMSDPAYPAELIQDGVEGTVMLSAIIGADGTVSDVSVLKSLDPQLDRNAVEAFSEWVFRPALKNGKAVDLRAVVTVPFRAKPIRY